MKRVLCTSLNASTLINNIPFEKTDEGMLSGPLEDAVAEQFAGINGYSLLDVVDDPIDPPQAPIDPPKNDKKAVKAGE